ncbi:MAG TPA: peptide-methionine (S)-S-oxide reductase MsrA [Thermoanaerobaculia bacterium]|nr:peptide-methionine (S)-S-oxide reductase MsrA [Thermoanaerobaculia bacterium]
MRLRHLLVLLAASLSAIAAGPPSPAHGLEKGTFAGGCFWSLQRDMEPIPGVVSVVSGYTGGTTVNPTYEQVSAGDTGHAEAVEVLFDPAKITYRRLLDHFWHNVDPTTADRQFCDRGPEYRSEIFYHSEEQRIAAEESRREIERTKTFRDPIVTQIVAAGPFYRAEEYHQDYPKKNPFRYHSYRTACRRDARLRELWGKTPES